MNQEVLNAAGQPGLKVISTMSVGYDIVYRRENHIYILKLCNLYVYDCTIFVTKSSGMIILTHQQYCDRESESATRRMC